MSVPSTLLEKTPDEVREELVGFPDETIEAVICYRDGGDGGNLTDLVLKVIDYYLPPEKQGRLMEMPGSTRLDEDLGADSLLLAEVVFKLEELFGVTINLHGGSPPQTLADLLEILRQRLG